MRPRFSSGRAAGGTVALNDTVDAGVAAAFEAAVRVRAPGVHASTPMVRELAIRVGRQLSLDGSSTMLLEASVRMRDVGVLGLSDTVLAAKGSLSPADWELVNRHPVIGAELLAAHPAVAPAAGIVRAHHERWDGRGYPDGLGGESIPLLGRAIAVCDAFVAMAADRPHRQGMGADAALEQISQQRGSQFDPRLVDALIEALAQPGRSRTRSGGNGTAAGIDRRQAGAERAPAGLDLPGAGDRVDLRDAVAELDVVPTFAPAYERVVATAAHIPPAGSDLVAAIESDTGLTIAILRAAQARHAKRPIANVPDAVAALTPAGVVDAVGGLPRAEFPWRASRLEALLHRSRVHAQAVARAADRIARVVRFDQRDDLLAAALLHDIGKLVLARAAPDYEGHETASPEERVRREQRKFGMDHGAVGGLLLGRWGLPKHLVTAVAEHHRCEAPTEIAARVRLADMVAHHAQGDVVDRRKLLRLAHLCGLSPGSLRDVLFDLPHAGGSERRRAEPSPLSDRETDVLRVLAQGRVYKVIAAELGLSTSTVRSHLHNAYAKLGVDDRAQAVLRATEMGWI
jgi:putative nucleotidyltransferase with HDIG domain